MSAAAPQGRVRPLGPLAALVECADLRSAVALHAHLTRAAPPGLVDCVAGAETVVVRARSTSALRKILAAARAAPGTPTGAEGSRTVTIDVVYDGEDRLDVPRWGTPRTAVPACSVALAGRFSAAFESAELWPRTAPRLPPR